MELEPVYRDPNHELNGAKYHTGKPCIKSGCGRPAGTYWSPLWCSHHNAERIDRINKSMQEILQEFKKGTPDAT